MARSRTVGLALVAVLAVAGGVLVRLGRDHSGGPPHPDRWDARIVPLVRFVEQNRGLTFRHPVAVDYLSDADFRRAVADENTEPEEQQRDDEAAARALGLPVGRNGLAAAGSTLSGEGITAYYDDGTGRVDVRGTDLTVDRRATIVHELTHALQDQHFDISRQGSLHSDDHNAAFEAVIEGDAVRLEDAYVDSLSKADQDAYDVEEAAGTATYDAGIKDVPDWLSATTDFPYSVGESFAEAVVAAGGRAGVDRALRTPPATVAEIMQPARYLRGEGPRAVPTPDAPAGDRVAKRNDLGALKWLLLLAERIPAADALRAADGWGGDAYLAYGHAGRICVKADFEGAAPGADDVMATALTAWGRAMPAASGATVSHRGGVVELASCDPGPAGFPAPSVPGSHVDEAMKLLTERAAAAVTPRGN
jgi:hypothetical protein